MDKERKLPERIDDLVREDIYKKGKERNKTTYYHFLTGREYKVEWNPDGSNSVYVGSDSEMNVCKIDLFGDFTNG